MIYLAWLAFTLVLAFLLDLFVLNLPVLCWLFGCSRGWFCDYCYQWGADKFHGPVWARRV